MIKKIEIRYENNSFNSAEHDEVTEEKRITIFIMSAVAVILHVLSHFPTILKVIPLKPATKMVY